MNVLQWIQQFAEDALKNNDHQRLQLISYAQQGDILRESQPKVAFQIFSTGRDLAERLVEPCWIMFFAHRMAHVCIFELEDLDAAMGLVTKDYMLSTKDEYIHCLINAAVRVNLVETYLYYDPVGYADTIEEVIAYLRETDTTDDYTTPQLDDFLAQLYLKRNQLDTALDYALRTLDDGYGYLTLNRIYWERGEYDKALQISKLRMENNKHSRFMYADAQAWTAAMLRQTNGDTHLAHKLYQQAIRQLHNINFVPNSTLFDALAGYHEADGDFTEALKIRDEQLKQQNPVAGPEEVLIVRLRRARLLGRMGDIEQLKAQLADIDTHLPKVKKAEHYHAMLRLIEDGYYSDVIWKMV
jgi:tetratricopeptide (TPR) repeat protein